MFFWRRFSIRSFASSDIFGQIFSIWQHSYIHTEVWPWWSPQISPFGYALWTEETHLKAYTKWLHTTTSHISHCTYAPKPQVPHSRETQLSRWKIFQAEIQSPFQNLLFLKQVLIFGLRLEKLSVLKLCFMASSPGARYFSDAYSELHSKFVSLVKPHFSPRFSLHLLRNRTVRLQYIIL